MNECSNMNVSPEKAKSFLMEAVLTCLKPHQTTDEVRASAESRKEKFLKKRF
jgi:hypothetical protein